MTACLLGVDVGGTFTDVVLGDGTGRLAATKVATTPDDPRDGVTEGVAAVLVREAVDAGDIVRVVHGTTLATNVILERRGARTAFVTTAGFGDLIRLGREFRSEEERFDLVFRPPPPPVPRHRTFELRERVGPAGEVLLAPAETDIEAVAAGVAAAGVEAVAICFLHAYANPAHERLMARACAGAMPDGTFIATSSEVWPEVREYERAMTTVLCAYVGPVMASYLTGLDRRLREMGIGCPVEVMDSSGGVMSAALAARRPVYTVESGGAAGVTAAGFVGRLIAESQVLSFDMGGTTAKTGVVRDGRPDITHEFHVSGTSGSSGRRRSGGSYPVKMPVVDVAEVGAGGGSIASVDAGGAIRVGPRSSGSVPGPACYGRGGTDATVTDANLLLGYLRPGPLSGGVSLSVDLAEKALEQAVANPLGLGSVDAARAVHDVANASMAAAIRMVTVQRGIDPRAFTLVAFGGAGPLHAAELAATFGMRRVVIPRAAGVASAVGLLASDLAAEAVRTWITPLAAAGAEELTSRYDQLQREAIAQLPAGDDAVVGARPTGGLSVTRLADLRCGGQAHHLTVTLPGWPIADTGLLEDRFVEHYRRTYGVDPSAPPEVVNLRVRVVRAVAKLALGAEVCIARDAEQARTGERLVRFGDGLDTDTPIYLMEEMHPGSTVDGPAVVEGSDTTVAVPPAFRLEVDRWRNLVLDANLV